MTEIGKIILFTISVVAAVIINVYFLYPFIFNYAPPVFDWLFAIVLSVGEFVGLIVEFRELF